MNRLTLTFDENLRTDRTQIQNIFQYSNTELLVLLTAVPSQSPTFNWITPGGVKLDERGLFRKVNLDTETHYAFTGTIYPGMTEGIPFGSDNGTVRMNLRISGVLSPLLKIPVDRAILPLQTELIPTNYNELLDEINVAAKLNTSNTFLSNNTYEGLTFFRDTVFAQGTLNSYDLNMNGNEIRNVGTPTVNSSAANKKYVDEAIAAIDNTAVPTTTIEPMADYAGPGHRIAVLSAEPATRYSGWIYIITE